jgi:hypothetical protein
MSDETKRGDDIPPADADVEDVDTEVERPTEPELSPGRLEEGTPESRPIDPRTVSPILP